MFAVINDFNPKLFWVYKTVPEMISTIFPFVTMLAWQTEKTPEYKWERKELNSLSDNGALPIAGISK
jgi:hypothetical protein